ncbi:Hemolysin, chromosomal [Fuerstiella marisgermanici]|uniref:Hemolysin, chromosomal n=1 Tax=Fuerstiella marisgermanici TaxID=1891926 RepID=A0A1P8WM76_9PLAN|nr:Hemolysin, chromosomal [Fuerstiella marisgermanici]
MRVRATDSMGVVTEKALAIEVLDTDGDYYDVIGTGGNDVFTAQYIGSGTNEWLVRRGGTTVFNGQLAAPTTKLRILATSGTDTITIQGTGGDDTFAVDGQAIEVNGFTVIGQSVETRRIFASSGTDTLIGPDTNSVWTIDDLNDGTLNTSTSFYDVESLVGGSADDTFRFTGGRFDYVGTLDTGDGWDTLDYSGFSDSVFVSWNTNRATGVGSSSGSAGAALGFESVIGSDASSETVEGPDSVNEWRITGENTGTLNNGQYGFTNVTNLRGGPQEDVFLIESAGALSGSLTGSTSDRIELADRVAPIDVNISDRNIPGVLGSYSGGELLIEGDNDNRLLGSTGSLSLQLNADGTATANGVHYSSGFAQFVGGSGTESLFAPELAADWYVTGEDTGYVLIDGQRFDFANAENLYGSDAVDTFMVQIGGNWNRSLIGQGGDDVFTVLGDVSSISAGSGTDLLIGPDTNSLWTIDDLNDGTLNTTAAFYDVESLVGGSADDTFRFTGGRFDYVGTLDTGDGWDTLDYSGFSDSVFVSWNTNRATGVGSSGGTTGAATGFEAVVGSGASSESVEGPDSVNEWRITGENTGTLNNGQYGFTNVTSLRGGPQEDVFQIESAGALSGSLTGSTSDRIELADRGAPIDVNISNRNIPGVLGGYFAGELLIEGDNDNRLLGSTGSLSLQLNADGTATANSVHYSSGFAQFVGGSGTESLFAPELAADWYVTGEDTGYVLIDGQRFDFANAENLYGSDAVDTFMVQIGGNWNRSLIGQGGDDVFTVLGDVGTISAGSGTDTLIGPDTNSLWTIDDRNDGTLNTTTSFYDVESLVGGSADDTFQFTGSSSDYIQGTLDGGGGWDTLDYSQYSYTVFVSWNTNRATGVGSSGGTTGAATGFEAVVGSGASNQSVEGPDSVNEWRITGENTGTLNNGQYGFTNVTSLRGGPQEDVFQIESAGALSGSLTGSTSDRIELADRGAPIDVNISNRNIPGVLGGYFAGELLIEGDNDNRLLGSTGSLSLQLNADGTATANSVHYSSGFAQFVGGSGTESLFAPELAADWYVTGEDTGYVLIDGQRFDFANAENLYGSDAVDTFMVQIGGNWNRSLIGQGGDDVFTVLGDVGTISAGSGTDTLIGPDTNSLWTIDDRNDGTLNTTTSFYDVESLVGGSADDTFQFTGSSSDYIQGTLDGGGGWDTLDYSQYSYTVFVSWNTNRATGVGSSGGTTGAATGFEAVVGSGASNQSVEGPDSVNEWSITGENAGTLNDGQYGFTNVGVLRGNSQEDVFIIESDGTYFGSFVGYGGTDRLELAERSEPLEVSVNARSIPGVLDSYSLEKVVAQAPADNQLLGSEANTNWQVAANGDIVVSSVTYTGFDSILGGSGDDTLLVDYTGDNLEAALQIAFDGGPGGNDGIGFTGGNFNTVSYDPAQGTLQLNDVTLELTTGNLINLTNSAITNLTVNIDQANLVATDIATTLSGSNTTDTLIAFSESLGGILVRNVTGRLSIQGDAVDSDSITLGKLGSSFSADVVVDGRGETDQVAFDDTFVLKNNDDLEVFAELITTAANAVVRTQGTGRVMFYGDEFELDLTSTIESANSVTVAPISSNRNIELGTTNVNALSLSTSMLERILSPSLTIGRAGIPGGTLYEGDITVAGDVTLAANTNLQVTTAGDIVLGSTIDTSGGTLSLSPGDSPHAVHVALSPTSVIASELSIASGSNLRFTINGTTANSEYSQLNLIGALDLTGVKLVMDGESELSLEDSFVLINNDGTDSISGTFATLPEGSVINGFLESPLSAKVSYLGLDAATGNDFVLAVIPPPNMAPVADAGGPYQVDEGGTVQLDASGSRDPDAPDETLTFEWDLDGDEILGETGTSAQHGDEVGRNPIFEAGLLDGPTNVTVEVRATDNSGDSHTATATVSVRNVAPTISLDSVVTVVSGTPLTLVGSFVDPGPDTWTATVNYADGSGDQSLTLNGDDFELAYTYNSAGIYTALVTIDDGDGGVTSKSLTVEVALPPSPDLTLISSDVLFNPINPSVGDAVNFIIDVTNAGTLAATNVPVSIQVYDADGEDFVEIGRRVIASIAADPEEIDPNSVVQFGFTWDGANGQPALPLEDAYLLVRVVVDPDSTIEELDESNNDAIQVLQIGSPATGSAALVANVPDRTFYRNELVVVGGQAFYDFSTLPGTDDFPVQNASVTTRLIDQNGQVLRASGTRTAINGNFRDIFRTPEEDGDYTLRFEISDGTFTEVFEATLTVNGESPDPLPPGPRGPAGPGYVFSSSLLFSHPTLPPVDPQPEDLTNPQIGDLVTITGVFDYDLDVELPEVQVTFNDLFPVLGQMRTFEIGSGSVSFPDGGSTGPAFLPMDWTPTAEGYHIIQVIAEPDFNFRAHTRTTRAVLVGDLDTTSLSVEYDSEIVPDPPPAFAPLSFGFRGFAAAAMADSETPAPGDTLKFTLSYENTGSTTITGGVLIDDFDETLLGMPTNISNDGIVDGNIIRWELGDIAPGTSGTVSYEVTIKSTAEFPPGSAFVLNTAILNADQAVAASTSELTVSNNAPVITGLNIDSLVDENGDVTLTGTFSDASSTDSHTVGIDWGDGRSDTLTFSAGERSFSIGHTYDLGVVPSVENYEVFVGVMDGSSQSDSKSATTSVSGVSPPSVTADVATITVDQGDIASNTGIFADTVGDVVIVSASIGTVTQNGEASGTWSWSLDTTDAPAETQTVTITATDRGGLTTQTTFTLTVIAAPDSTPVIDSLTTDATTIGDKAAGETVTLTAALSDFSAASLPAMTIRWGDGSADSANISSTGAIVNTHTYADGGVYTVTLSFDDGDGESASTEALLSGVGIQDGVLNVVGSAGLDQVILQRRSGASYLIRSNTLGTHNVSPTAFTSIYVQLGDGNDRFNALGNFEAPLIVDAGAGNDRLVGSRGGDVLLGGEGNDYIWAGSGNNIVIGGTGRDFIFGGSGTDLLIAGTTKFDQDSAALRKLQAEWTSERSVQQRIANLYNGSGSTNRLNEDNFLTVGTEGSVQDDDERDLLFGGGSMDWLFYDKQEDIAYGTLGDLLNNDLDDLFND